MCIGNHHLWWLGRSLGLEGLKMHESVKAGEWIGKHLFAFPANHFDLADSEHGMTLRDYFAAQALTGAQIWDAVLNGKDSNFLGSRGGVNLLAEISYAVADAMLKERTKQ
jgi:hypothetical protein